MFQGCVDRYTPVGYLEGSKSSAGLSGYHLVNEGGSMSSSSVRVTFVAPDISCGHCVETVNNTLNALDGVQQVESSEETKKVSVAYDPSTVSEEQIAAAMSEAGYPVSQ
jgi:copper chaperone